MKSNTLLYAIAVCAMAILFGSTPARAQGFLGSVPPPSSGPVPPTLHNCTAEALNVSGYVGSDGSVAVFNVPTTKGPVTLRVTCTDESGATVTGKSAPLTQGSSGALQVDSLVFGGPSNIPTTLQMSPNPNRISAGASYQLSVGATFPDSSSALDGGTAGPSTQDVTAASTGTVYSTSNPAVATVSADGLVTGVSTGTALIFALNEGFGGFATVTVSPPVTSLAISPAPPNGLTLVQWPQPSLFPVQSVQLQVLANGGTIDLTAASTGMLYSVAPAGVVLVTADGLVVPIPQNQSALPVSATITATDSVSGKTATLPVTITGFAPQAVASYALPGKTTDANFACKVDVAGTLAYVANGNSGLQVMDVSLGPTSGKIVGSLLFPGAGAAAVDVKLQNPLAAVGLANGSVSLVNVKTPSAPTEYARVTPGGTTRSVSLSNNTLYVATSTGYFTYDVTNPASPRAIDTCSLPSWAVSGDGTRQIAAVLTTGFSLAIMQTGSCTPVANLPLNALASGLPPNAGALGGVNPAQPGDELVGPQAYDVVLFGTSAYVALGTNGVQQIDLTNPSNPNPIGSTACAPGVPPCAEVGPIPGGTGEGSEAKGVAVRQTPQGTLVAIADTVYLNTIPLFNASLNNFYNINACSSTAPCTFPDGFPAVQPDPNGQGIALGEGFGVQCGSSGGGVAGEAPISMLQVFSTQPAVDNTTVPPNVWITSPSQGSTVTADAILAISAVATDDVGVASVQFFANGSPVSGSSTAPWTAGFLTPGQGQITLTAVATDFAGNSTESTPVVVSVVAPPPGSQSLSLGTQHACQVLGNNSVVCWGSNVEGQLGTNTRVQTELNPVPVLGITNATSVTAGDTHTCALLATGAVSCWGNNSSGQLGNPIANFSLVPVPVTGITNAVAVAAGFNHTCAVLQGGSVMCWGSNASGQLGVAGSVSSTNTPLQVVGISNAVAVTAGDIHTCALLSTGQVTCWGDNSEGELGDGTNTNRPTPTTTVTGITNATAISAGFIHNCALLSSGAVTCWGDDGNGELGNGTAGTTFNTPQSVKLGGNAIGISTGWFHSCAVLSSGAAECWGSNDFGQLGDLSTSDTNSAVRVVFESNDLVQIASRGDAFTCAVSSSVGTLCWGLNNDGQLGTGAPTTTEDGGTSFETEPTAVLFSQVGSFF